MTDSNGTIEVTLDRQSGKQVTYLVKFQDAETLAVALLKEVSKRSPDRHKPLVERTPVIFVPHPSFVMNTNLMHEVVLSLASHEGRPFSYTLTRAAVSSMLDGLAAMLRRIEDAGPITKQ